MKKLLLLMIPVLVTAVSASEMLVNGDFEQELTVGWTFTDSGYGTHTCDRATDYHPDPDYEAQTYQYDNPGWARLGQTVDVPSPLLALSFWAKFEYSGGSSSCWPAACFSVRYFDAASNLLGETRYFYSAYANWTPSATFHPIEVSTPDWTEYSLDIEQELADNLPGITPGQVAKVEVALYSYTYSG